MALKIYVFILTLSFNIFAEPVKALLEEAMLAKEQDKFVLSVFENKIETLCLNKNKRACDILLYVKFARNTVQFSEKLSRQLQQDTANAFSVLFAEYLQFMAKNPIKNLTPIEVPSIKHCIKNSGNCRDAGYLHNKLSNGNTAYTLYLWSKGCQGNDFKSCKELADFYAHVDSFSPDSALKYAEKSCGAKASGECKEKERIYEEIKDICKIDGFLPGLGGPRSKSHFKCIQNVCKNFKSEKRSGQCNASDFIVFNRRSKKDYLNSLFHKDVFRCFNEEWDYCYSKGLDLYEGTDYASYGTSFHVLFLPYMACSNGYLEACSIICTYQKNPEMLPFDKSILDKMNMVCE
jgi:hypothetical protein